MILVFGKTGQVARELARVCPEAVFLGRAEADLCDPAGCAARIRALRPKAVINAAAYTAVDRAEEEEDLANLVNGAAPGAMAAACAALGVPFLHVSTDYVFDGSGTRPWTPEDAVNPVNAYGRSKLAGERAIAQAGGRWAVLRTSWVFSAHGNNFVKTMLRLSESRDALSVVSDQIGGPTPARGIAQALVQMAQAMITGQGGGIYHYAGTPATSWACFARETFALAGRDVTVTDIPSADYPTPAARPLNSRLDCSGLETDFGIKQPEWKTALADVINEVSA
jgi:dTDP-4-dehydrorhamnose reductase